MYFYYDYYYLLLILPAMIFAFWASARVKTTFKKYSATASIRGFTGRDAAEAVLRQNGITDVRIESVGGDLTDHYDPRTKVIRLSEKVYHGNNAAAIGVAAHEAGHAAQHHEEYAPLKFRNAIIPVTNIGSRLAMPLLLLGLFLSYYGEKYLVVAYAGVICFSLSTLFQLFTLPTEFNASKRALEAIESGGILAESEIPGARKVLSAAALTYVAALAVSLLQLLRLILIVNNRRRD
ncbi:MAG: zinc metallopeptidase [Ruminococcaceae bacterium]|nr:zinc metallopeptidase [Oscillospiraceae bacterium]